MLNIIKMDLYRMKKYKSTWILLLVMVAISALSLLVAGLLKANGVSSNLAKDGTMIPDTFFAIYMRSLQSGNMMILIIISSIFMVNGKFKFGYIKNIAGKVSKRYRLIVSNLITTAIFTLLLMVVTGLTCIIGSLLFLHLDVGSSSGFIRFMLVQFLLYMSFSSVIICVVSVSRSTAFSMAFLITYVTVIGPMLVLFGDLILHNLLKVSDNFSLGNYTVMQNIAKLGMKYDQTMYIRAIIIGIIVFGFTSAISAFAVTKKEIK